MPDQITKRLDNLEKGLKFVLSMATGSDKELLELSTLTLDLILSCRHPEPKPEKEVCEHKNLSSIPYSFDGKEFLQCLDCRMAVEIIKSEEKKKEERWVPEKNKIYWFFSDWGKINYEFWQGDSSDKFRQKLFGVFKTKEEAQVRLNQILGNNL